MVSSPEKLLLIAQGPKPKGLALGEMTGTRHCLFRPILTEIFSVHFPDIVNIHPQ